MANLEKESGNQIEFYSNQIQVRNRGRKKKVRLEFNLFPNAPKLDEVKFQPTECGIELFTLLTVIYFLYYFSRRTLSPI